MKSKKTSKVMGNLLFVLLRIFILVLLFFWISFFKDLSVFYFFCYNFEITTVFLFKLKTVSTWNKFEFLSTWIAV